MCLIAEKSESSKNNNLIKIMSESVHKLLVTTTTITTKTDRKSRILDQSKSAIT